MRTFTSFVNKLLLWFKRNRIYTFAHIPLKVNIGCGLSVEPEWINVDGNIFILLRKSPKYFKRLFYSLSSIKNYMDVNEFIQKLENNKFVHHDIMYGIPFSNESIDFIYTSHFLEHLYREDGIKFLSDSYRVLKTGGIIRICIPDLQYAISLYIKGEKDKSLEFFFSKYSRSSFDMHKYLYDFPMLSDLLREIGFSDIQKLRFQKGIVPDIDKLDNRPEETLFIEAIK